VTNWHIADTNQQILPATRSVLLLLRAMSLVPPENFAMSAPASLTPRARCPPVVCWESANANTLTPFRVTHGIYRSSYPTKKTLPFLKQIGVRSIVYLCLEEYTEGAKKFIEENDIRLFPHGTPGITHALSPAALLRLTAACRQQRAIRSRGRGSHIRGAAGA
jgi:hypothetical protein